MMRIGLALLALSVLFIVGCGSAWKEYPVELTLKDGTIVYCRGLSGVCSSGCDFYCKGPNTWYKWPSELREYRFVEPR